MSEPVPPSPDDLRLARIIWDYMFLRSKPKKADVIIGLGCHDMNVADDAARLYREGLAPIIVFTGKSGRLTGGMFPESEAGMMRSRAIKLGVPEEAILIEEASTNTGENIRFSQRLLAERGLSPSTVMLVHKPYMLRRDYATFMKQWTNPESVDVHCWASQSECERYVLAAADPHGEIAIIVGDLQRMRQYAENGFQIGQKIPAAVWKAYEQLVRRGYDTHLVG